MTTTKNTTCADLVLTHIVDARAGNRAVHFPQWLDAHEAAWRAPRAGGERAIKSLIDGYAALADASFSGCGILLGDDAFYCDHAVSLVDAMRAALNLDCGRLDCGTLDRLLCRLAAASGVTLDE
jgi:hypothetical protein